MFPPFIMAAIAGGGLPNELNAGNGMDRSLEDTGTGSANATVEFYGLTNAVTARRGEVWSDEGGIDTKLGDWFDPTATPDGSFWARWSNLVGDTPNIGDPVDTWVDITTNGLFNVGLGVGSATDSCTFDIELSRDGSTVALDQDAGPFNWSLVASG